MSDFIELPIFGQDDLCYEYARVSCGSIEKHELGYTTYNSKSSWYGRNSLNCKSLEELDAICKEIRKNVSEGKPGLTAYVEELMPDGADICMQNNGFKNFLVQTGMVFDLSWPFDQTRNPSIITIGKDAVHEWTEVMTEGFKPEKQLEYEIYDNFSKSDDVVFYAYTENGKIIGTSMLLKRSSNAGIHEVAVPKEYRHRKIATSLVLRMLQDLKEYECSEVSLQASPFGRPVYAAIGFKEVCHIPTWLP